MPDVLRVRCQECGIKWFFEGENLKRPKADFEICGACGGRLEPLEEDQDAGRP